MNRKKVHLGIDVGGTNMRFGLVDTDLKVYEIKKYKTQSGDHTLKSLVLEYVSKHQEQFNITGITIGFPGIVNPYTKAIVDIPNAKFLESTTTIHELEKTLNIPVSIGKDVNLLMAYDRMDHNILDVKNVLGFYVGTGFGFGIFLNGKPYVGDNLYAGEIGHIPFYQEDETGLPTGLEYRTAGTYIKYLMKTHFQDENIDDLFVNHLQDPRVYQIVDHLSKVIASVLIILNVEHVILGGGVFHMKGFPMKNFQQMIRSYLRNDITMKELKFFIQKESDEAGIIGAYLLYINQNT